MRTWRLWSQTECGCGGGSSVARKAKIVPVVGYRRFFLAACAATSKATFGWIIREPPTYLVSPLESLLRRVGYAHVSQASPRLLKLVWGHGLDVAFMGQAAVSAVISDFLELRCKAGTPREGLQPGSDVLWSPSVLMSSGLTNGIAPTAMTTCTLLMRTPLQRVCGGHSEKHGVTPCGRSSRPVAVVMQTRLVKYRFLLSGSVLWKRFVSMPTQPICQPLQLVPWWAHCAFFTCMAKEMVRVLLRTRSRVG